MSVSTFNTAAQHMLYSVEAYKNIGGQTGLYCGHIGLLFDFTTCLVTYNPIHPSISII